MAGLNSHNPDALDDYLANEAEGAVAAGLRQGFSKVAVNGLRERIERMLRRGIRSIRSKNPLTALPLSHNL